MTNLTLAEDYLKRAKIRLKALDTLYQEGGHADVVRESQELVELVLKALLRRMGIEPPHWHDVSSILKENTDRLPADIIAELARIAALSIRLRKERELAYYGDEDYIPSEQYTTADSEYYIAECRWLVQLIDPVVSRK